MTCANVADVVMRIHILCYWPFIGCCCMCVCASASLSTRVCDGSHFSLGERQLLCFARALMSRSRILVMDEATAAVDFKVSSLLQAITVQLRATVVLIAHRLTSVVELDKVLVMEAGRVVEFDTPARLLSNPLSRLSLLVLAEKAEPREE
jgi:ABC-type multidrug transport system fused ATPase/permease subunit